MFEKSHRTEHNLDDDKPTLRFPYWVVLFIPFSRLYGIAPFNIITQSSNVSLSFCLPTAAASKARGFCSKISVFNQDFLLRAGLEKNGLELPLKYHFYTKSPLTLGICLQKCRDSFDKPRMQIHN